MKTKQKITICAVLIILVTAAIAIYLIRIPNDKCTNRDRKIDNCVPAGKCGPTPAIDAVIDCDVKNYDKKYNQSL
ncbi:MAG: hypothetical protein V4702_00015 [Patescibacteria group bacterium]